MTSSEQRTLNSVLSRIKQQTGAEGDDYAYPEEWYCLYSDSYGDYELYQALRRKWSSIVNPYFSQFALVYCEAGYDSGVWLHYLNNASKRSEFLCGAHYVPEW